MSKSKDISFIIWMQMIGCLLVIVGHSYPFVMPVPIWASKLQRFIYDFHMPLFVWCSGYLMVATNQVEKYLFPEYLKRRMRHILVPYITFSLLGILPKLLLSDVLNDTFKARDLLRALLVPRESIWGHFWFLPMIFVLGLIGYGLIKINIQNSRGRIVKGVFFLIGIAAFFMPTLTGWLAINDIIHYFIYFVVGIICGSWKVRKLRYICVSIVCVAVSVSLFWAFDNHSFARLLISFLMIYAVFCIAQLLSELCRIDRKSIFAQTYSIFILSWPCQLMVEIVLERIMRCGFYVTFPCEIIVGVVAPLLIIKFVEWFEANTHTKIISVMIGR